MDAAALYVGTLRHRRHRPAAHEFRYSLFMVLLDVDRIAEAMTISWLTGYNRRRWAAFDDRDHIGDPSRPLRQRVQASADSAGVDLPDGPIHLLTHLRYAGYVFNPISLFYCYDRNGRLRRVLADVRNTYGGRQQYWLAPADGRERRLRALAAKSLYVSPFMAFNVDYEFVLTPPEDTLVAHMNVLPRDMTVLPHEMTVLPHETTVLPHETTVLPHETTVLPHETTVLPHEMTVLPHEMNVLPHDTVSRTPIFDATLTLQRRPWTAAAVRAALLRQPLMTAKVIAAIHWEALRLRLKGLPILPMPSRTS